MVMSAMSEETVSTLKQTVGVAGMDGNDVIVSHQVIVVDLGNNGGKVVASGIGDDDLLGTGIDVSLGLSLRHIEAGALQDDINTQLAPGQLSGIGLGIDGDDLTVDDDVVLASLDGVSAEGQRASTLSGLELQQVRQYLGRGQVVDSDNLEALSTEHLPEGLTANTTETIDSNLNRHKKSLHLIVVLMIFWCFAIPHRTFPPFLGSTASRNSFLCRFHYTAMYTKVE